MAEAPREATAAGAEQTVRALLAEQSSMTLATAGADGPWAAAVFFAGDAELRLYFVSDPRSRHGRHLAETGHAAAAIHPDCDHWAGIQGIQLEGAVCILDGATRDAALALYLEKFPRIRALVDAPADEQEARIARRLAQATVYRLTPERLRLIDNGRGFGFKQELVPPAPGSSSRACGKAAGS